MPRPDGPTTFTPPRATPDEMDRKRFTEIFHTYYPPLARYARRYTGDAATAADVLQDVFLKLWEQRQTMTVEVSLRALLYTMVRNRALNVLRHRRNAVPEADAEIPMVPANDAAFSAGEIQRHLYRWIDELPPRRAEAFLLSRYHGLKHREIAAIMNVSVRTVETHIVLALRELRRRLDVLQDT